MAVLEWDQAGERLFQSGVDRGVLYLMNGQAAVWNGLTTVEESSDQDSQPYYLDGIKYLDHMTHGDFSGKLKAYTYPDEFEMVNGVEQIAGGLSYHNQATFPFNLSYRTRVGNDLEGIDHGYKIHLLYNVIAKPDNSTFDSLEAQAKALEFGWDLDATPPLIAGHRPTAHISVDSTKTDPDVLQSIEDLLYGTPTTNPRFPSIDEITRLFSQYGSFVVIDNGDGTWTGIDQANEYVTMVSPTEFRVDGVDATYSDPETYTVSTTNP